MITALNHPCVLILGLSLWAASVVRAEQNQWVPVPLEDLRSRDVSQPASSPTPQTQPAEAEAPPTSSPAPDARLSPEEIARRLRSDREVPVTPSRGWRRKTEPPTRLPAEGTAVIGRIGWIAKGKDDGWRVVTFENGRNLSNQPPRRLLPCRLLEEVEARIEENPTKRFRFSGETTTDSKHAYLLLQRVEEVEPGATDLRPLEPAPVETAPATQTTSQPASSDDNIGELIGELLRQRPGRAVRVAPSPRRTARENVESVAPAGRRPFSPGKRDLVVDRIVRIVKDSESPWWEGRFESDNTLREPPVRVLPSLHLEWIRQRMRKTGFRDLRLRVSGDITYYRGKRYLLLRKVLYQRDMDQF